MTAVIEPSAKARSTSRSAATPPKLKTYAFEGEKTILRPLANRSPITLFMATLGLAYVVEGGAQLLWGGEVHGLDIGIPLLTSMASSSRSSTCLRPPSPP